MEERRGEGGRGEEGRNDRAVRHRPLIRYEVELLTVHTILLLLGDFKMRPKEFAGIKGQIHRISCSSAKQENNPVESRAHWRCGLIYTNLEVCVCAVPLSKQSHSQ